MNSAFDKAKEDCYGDTTNAKVTHLSNLIELKLNKTLGYKTLERAYKKYVLNEADKWSPSEDSVNIICKYLDYENYQGYLKSKKGSFYSLNFKNGETHNTNKAKTEVHIKKKETDLEEVVKPNSRRFFKVSAGIIITILVFLLVIVFGIGKNIFHISNDIETIRRISANELPNYIETNHMVWRGVSQTGEMEYFTGSGKHPITGKSLYLVSDEEMREIIKVSNVTSVDSENDREENKLVEKSILNPSFKNNISSKEMAIFIFGEDSQLNNKVSSQLQDVVFNNYNTTGSLVLPNILDKNIETRLLEGNIFILGNTIDKHTDYICVGETGYTFRTSDINAQMSICDLELTYSVYNTKGIREKNLSKSDVYTGQGFTKQEAKNNAIKRVQ